MRRLQQREPSLAQRAKELDHVLPPRPSGAFALLQGAPTADLVVCTNTGFEAFDSLRAILKSPTSDRPVIVETWRIARAEIPSTADEFRVWLFEQYLQIDAWVNTQTAPEATEPNESEC